MNLSGAALHVASSARERYVNTLGSACTLLNALLKAVDIDHDEVTTIVINAALDLEVVSVAGLIDLTVISQTRQWSRGVS